MRSSPNGVTKMVVALIIVGFVSAFGFLLAEDRSSIKTDAAQALVEARAANVSVGKIEVDIKNMAEDIKEIKELLKEERKDD